VGAAGATDPEHDRLTMPILGTGLEGADIWSAIATLAAICNANPGEFSALRAT
jgi:hypothetical protein